jgi:hypothetical protein
VHGIGALDARLAAIDPRSPLAAEAVRLRALWRSRLGDPSFAREGMQILDVLLPRVHTREDLRLRARLAERANAITGALATWMDLARSTGPRARRVGDARSGLELLRSGRADALGREEREAWMRDFEAVERSAEKSPGRM